MTYFLFLLSLSASMLGAACGVGGGILIKPVLDVTGFLNVSIVNYLSGCTVLSMTTITVLKNSMAKEKVIKLKVGISTCLAIGAMIGGILGNRLFSLFLENVFIKNYVTNIQALAIIFITIGTLIYFFGGNKISKINMEHSVWIVLIGIQLGLLSSFLGIGGGPMNLVVLTYFFSMKKREASINSLYIIFFSQLVNLLFLFLTDKLPIVKISYLIIMIGGGIVGGLIGSHISKKLNEPHMNFVFIILMVAIILINMAIFLGVDLNILYHGK